MLDKSGFTEETIRLVNSALDSSISAYHLGTTLSDNYLEAPAWGYTTTLADIVRSSDRVLSAHLNLLAKEHRAHHPPPESGSSAKITGSSPAFCRVATNS